MAAIKKPLSKSKSPKPFDWNDTLIESVQKRANKHGRVGALISKVVMARDRTSAMHFLNHLSNIGFYGEDIWYGFESYCRSDVDMFAAVVEIEDKGFYNHVLDWKSQQALKYFKGKDV